MAKVEFEYRLFITENFLRWLYTLDSRKYFDITKRLMYINYYSEHHHKERAHNIILREQLSSLIGSGYTSLIEAKRYMKSTNESEEIGVFNSSDNAITKTIKMAIKKANERQEKVAILTSPTDKTQYVGSTHLVGISNIEIRDGDTATALIESMFNQII